MGQYCIYSPAGNPCRRSHSVSFVRHEKRFHRWRKPCSRSTLCPLIKSSFFGFAPRQLSLSPPRTSWWRTPPATARKRCTNCTAPASHGHAQLHAIQDRGRQDYWRAVRQAHAAGWKGFRRHHHGLISAGCHPADQPAPAAPSRMSPALPSANPSLTGMDLLDICFPGFLHARLRRQAIALLQDIAAGSAGGDETRSPDGAPRPAPAERPHGARLPQGHPSSSKVPGRASSA